MVMGKIKRLPTGISQFRRISDDNLYYVDKTMFLPKMDQVSDDMIDPNLFVCLLYYNGMLTIGGTYLDRLHLVVPNLSVLDLYKRFVAEQ